MHCTLSYNLQVGQEAAQQQMKEGFELLEGHIQTSLQAGFQQIDRRFKELKQGELMTLFKQFCAMLQNYLGFPGTNALANTLQSQLV